MTGLIRQQPKELGQEVKDSRLTDTSTLGKIKNKEQISEMQKERIERKQKKIKDKKEVRKVRERLQKEFNVQSLEEIIELIKKALEEKKIDY